MRQAVGYGATTPPCEHPEPLWSRAVPAHDDGACTDRRPAAIGCLRPRERGTAWSWTRPSRLPLPGAGRSSGAARGARWWPTRASRGRSTPTGSRVAVSEAVTNAVVHAYVDAPAPGEVEVFAKRDPDDGLEVHVSDEGRGMMPRRDSPGIGVGLAAHDDARRALPGRDAPGRRDGGQHDLRRP